MVWTTTDLLSSIRRRARIPDGSEPFSNTELLAMADEETLTCVMPLVRRVKQEYGIAIYDQSIVSGTLLYSLPTRTVGGTVKAVVHVDSNEREVPIQPISLTALPGFVSNRSDGWPTHYAMQGDRVHLTGSNGTTLRIKYYRRPGKLIETSSACLITDQDPGTPGYVDVDSTAGFSAPDGADVVHGRPQFDLPLEGIVAVTVDSNTLSLATAALVTIDVPAAGVLAGDWVTPADQTPVPQIPDLCHPVLVMAVVVRVLESLGNAEMLPAAQAKLEEAKQAVEALIEQRDEGASAKWVSTSSPLRGGARGRGRRW